MFAKKKWWLVAACVVFATPLRFTGNAEDSISKPQADSRFQCCGGSDVWIQLTVEPHNLNKIDVNWTMEYQKVYRIEMLEGATDLTNHAVSITWRRRKEETPPEVWHQVLFAKISGSRFSLCIPAAWLEKSSKGTVGGDGDKLMGFAANR